MSVVDKLATHTCSDVLLQIFKSIFELRIYVCIVIFVSSLSFLIIVLVNDFLVKKVAKTHKNLNASAGLGTKKSPPQKNQE